MNLGEDIPTFISRFEEVYRKLQDAGDEIKEDHRCFQLLQSLPEDYDNLIREFDRLEDSQFKFDTIKSEILKEVSRREFREKQHSESYATSSKSQATSLRSPSKKASTELKLETICSICNKQGHNSHNCRNKSKSYIAELIDNSCYTNDVFPPCWEWTLDSASTAHVCQNRHFFISMRSAPEDSVIRMGTTPHTVRGIGECSFKVNEKGRINTITLTKVLYVPDIHRNLISMSKMDRAGFHAKMDRGFKIFSPSWKYLYTAKLQNNFYVLKAMRVKFSEPDNDSPVSDIHHPQPTRRADSSSISKTTFKNQESSHTTKTNQKSEPRLFVNSREKNNSRSTANSADNRRKSQLASQDCLENPRKKSKATATSPSGNSQVSTQTESRKVETRNQSPKTLADFILMDEHCSLKNLKVDEIKTERNDTVSKNYNATYATDMNNIMLWHERLGHSSINIIRKMFREGLVSSASQLQGKESRCEPCILAKNTRATHPKLSHIRSKSILELIHSDLWGPAPVASRNGNRYILTFLDDYSRRAFCYPLRSKQEVPAKVKHFINFVERQTSKKIKVLRTDNGLEFCNRVVNDLLNDLGIKHERTSVYSPQMNGVAERYNRVLFEGMRTFSLAANLPAKLWVEAVMATNYIRNRILHTGIDAIPFQRWYGTKPSIRHLKRYGCIAYVHQPKEKRNKFQPRAKRGIFVGYGLGSSGYRIWFPSENIIVESKHVTFDEAQLGRPRDDKVVSAERSFIDFFNDDEVFTPGTQVEVKDDSCPDPSASVEDLTNNDILQDETRVLKEENEDTREPDQASSSSSTKTNEEYNDDPSSVTFLRILNVRKKGRTKGRIDVYVKAPTGKRLRSEREFKTYCKEHRLICDEIPVSLFSANNQYQGPIKMQKYSESIENSEDEEVSADSQNEACITEVIIPTSPKQAKRLPESQQWKEAMDAEIKTMLEREVWTPVEIEDGQKIIGTKWVYTIKRNEKKQINTFKARLVALGNNQREGLDYDETFSPVVNFTLIRIFFSVLISVFHWVHALLDVKCAYLYGDIDKEIFIRQPADYIIEGKENCVLKLNKAIYGLHQSGRCWYHDLHSKLISSGFQEVPGISCVYTYNREALVLVYVDDLPIFAKNEEILKEVVELIKSIYEVKELGKITTLLGIDFKEKGGNYNINCENYIEKCLKKFEVETFAQIALPSAPGYYPSPRQEKEELPEHLPFRSLLGCLQYISHRCRPDIGWNVATLSQFSEKPSMEHYKSLLRILMYLSTTKSYGLKYNMSNPPLQMLNYADASWASDSVDRKSWSGYIIFINGAPVTWRVVKQTCVSLSPMEAEFISASEAVKEMKFIDTTLTEIQKMLDLPATMQKPILLCDNTATISFTKKSADNVRNKHIDLKYKFIRDEYQSGVFDIKHVPSKENIADILTKALPRAVFENFRDNILIE